VVPGSPPAGHGQARPRTGRARGDVRRLGADPAQLRQLPERLQELLGYNQPSPYLGFINGQHPRQWLMNDVAQPNRG
jgi:hypothetical protein